MKDSRKITITVTRRQAENIISESKTNRLFPGEKALSGKIAKELAKVWPEIGELEKEWREAWRINNKVWASAEAKAIIEDPETMGKITEMWDAVRDLNNKAMEFSNQRYEKVREMADAKMAKAGITRYRSGGQHALRHVDDDAKLLPGFRVRK